MRRRAKARKFSTCLSYMVFTLANAHSSKTIKVRPCIFFFCFANMPPKTRSKDGTGPPTSRSKKGLPKKRVVFRSNTNRVLRMRFKDGRSISHYAFLIFSQNKGKKNTFIGLSRNPVNKVYHFNNGTIRHRRGGKSNGNKWFLQQIVGPFDTADDGRRFREAWTCNSRSLRGRSSKGRELAKQASVACWEMSSGDHK